MSTNTWAVDRVGKRVFDLGNHSTPLVPGGQKTVVYDCEGLAAAKNNIQVVNERVSYGVDASGKRAVDQCLAWMRIEGVETVELLMEGSPTPWKDDEYKLRPDWVYLTPFRSRHVVPDPYTLGGEVYFHVDGGS